MTSQIEKGIPIPKRHHWGDMEVGDSVFFPYTPMFNAAGRDSIQKFAVRVYNRAYTNGRRLGDGRKWKVAVDQKDGQPGVRAWRIA